MPPLCGARVATAGGTDLSGQPRRDLVSRIAWDRAFKILSMAGPNSVFDVIDGLVGEDEYARFRDGEGVTPFEMFMAIREFYSGWSPPPRKDHEIRVFPIPPNPVVVPFVPAAAIVSETSSEFINLPSQEEGLRRVYSGAFLYADTVCAIDPLTIHPFRSVDHTGQRHAVHQILAALRHLRPLVEAGALLLVPAELPIKRVGSWRAVQPWLDARPPSPKAAGVLDKVVSHHWNGWYKLNLIATAFGLEGAARADAIVFNGARPDWDLVLRMLADGGDDASLHRKTTAALARIDLPVLQADPATLLKVRGDEDSFAAWRAELRLAARLIDSAHDEEDFDSEAEEILTDFLLPQTKRLQASISRSEAMRSALRDAPLQAAIGAAVTAGLGAPLGLSVTGAAAAAIGGTVGAVATAGLRPSRPTGATRVLMELMR